MEKLTRMLVRVRGEWEVMTDGWVITFRRRICGLGRLLLGLGCRGATVA